MAAKIEVKKEFAIPTDYLRKPIKADLLPLFGIAADSKQEDLLLAPVLVLGKSYGGGASWEVSARSGHDDDQARFIKGDDEVNFGTAKISYENNSRIAPSTVLVITERWIRESEKTEFVPGGIMPLPAPEHMAQFVVNGLILVRAASR